MTEQTPQSQLVSYQSSLHWSSPSAFQSTEAYKSLRDGAWISATPARHPVTRSRVKGRWRKSLGAHNAVEDKSNAATSNPSRTVHKRVAGRTHSSKVIVTIVTTEPRLSDSKHIYALCWYKVNVQFPLAVDGACIDQCKVRVERVSPSSPCSTTSVTSTCRATRKQTEILQSFVNKVDWAIECHRRNGSRHVDRLTQTCKTQIVTGSKCLLYNTSHKHTRYTRSLNKLRTQVIRVTNTKSHWKNHFYWRLIEQVLPRWRDSDWTLTSVHRRSGKIIMSENQVFGNYFEIFFCLWWHRISSCDGGDKNPIWKW
jgi:hypothetical protein